MRYVFLVLLASGIGPIPTAVEAQVATTPSVQPISSYAAHRVYDSKRKRITDLEGMIVELNKADIVFLGEQHNDPRTHQLQAAILEGIARRRTGPVVLALEMFERDVQGPLDAYLSGELTEPAFLAASRPWPNYSSDYRPMVEFAKAHGWPVIAGNVPRRLASVVSRAGLAALDTLPDLDRALVAGALSCPRDDYFKRFKATMGDMSGHGMELAPEELAATVWRIYEAQCVKDETMGEAIANAHTRLQAPVVHANGAFHSDYRYGTVERVRLRLPKARIAVVSFVPVADLDEIDGKGQRKLGDWVVFTLETPKPKANP